MREEAPDGSEAVTSPAYKADGEDARLPDVEDGLQGHDQTTALARDGDQPRAITHTGTMILTGTIAYSGSVVGMITGTVVTHSGMG